VLSRCACKDRLTRHCWPLACQVTQPAWHPNCRKAVSRRILISCVSPYKDCLSGSFTLRLFRPQGESHRHSLHIFTSTHRTLDIRSCNLLLRTYMQMMSFWTTTADDNCTAASCCTKQVWLLVHFIHLRADLVPVSPSIYYIYLNTSIQMVILKCTIWFPTLDVRFVVVTAVTMKNGVFGDVTP
jgi:hypothetical protein